MLFFGLSEKASRKYIDLIHQSSSKWANWDPPKQIKTGDYGTINRQDGSFMKQGNVYEDKTTAVIAKEHPPKQCAPLDEYIASSSDASRQEFTVDPVLTPGLAKASFKGQWKFGNKRGAVLMMHQPRLTSLPDELLDKLLNASHLEGKVLIKEVYDCIAYSMYLSNKKNETVKFALQIDIPVVAPAGGRVEASWWSEGAVGLHQHASRETYSFTPLYALQRIFKPSIWKLRDGGGEQPTSPCWGEADVPWGMLDDSGDEDEFVDDIENFDSD